MDENGMVLCYNKGCGQRFDPSENNEQACVYHPGAPVFHDAYKSWSCCSKKTTDFTDFLNIKGCSTSYHTNIKPPEVPKQKPSENVEEKDPVENISTHSTSSKPKPLVRPSEDEPLERLKYTVTSSLKSELQKLGDKTECERTVSQDNITVLPGTSCKNGGCKKRYESESDNTETCMHHPGVPVFHEGMKFWTCCMKRTSDFENFLEQLGCTVGNHLWMKPKSSNDIKNSCRYDWYQTGPYIYVTVYAKVPIPDQSYVEINKVKLHAHIEFGQDHEKFQLEISLFGIIDTSSSSVQFAGNKVEIKLKKAEASKWSSLTSPEADVKRPEDKLEEDLDDVLKL